MHLMELNSDTVTVTLTCFWTPMAISPQKINVLNLVLNVKTSHMHLFPSFNTNLIHCTGAEMQFKTCF